MARPSGYRFLLAAEAFRFLLTLRAAERQMLDDVFETLARQPFLTGDYQEYDGDGRPMEVLLKGRFLLTFWSDHAAKEVRVVRVERI